MGDSSTISKIEPIKIPRPATTEDLDKLQLKLEIKIHEAHEKLLLSLSEYISSLKKDLLKTK